MQGQPVEDERHVEPERYRSGLPGRPSSKHLIEQEFRRRASANECKSTLSAEARELHEWLKKEYPDAPPATPKTITNNIRIEYNRLVR